MKSQRVGCAIVNKAKRRCCERTIPTVPRLKWRFLRLRFPAPHETAAVFLSFFPRTLARGFLLSGGRRPNTPTKNKIAFSDSLLAVAASLASPPVRTRGNKQTLAQIEATYVAASGSLQRCWIGRIHKLRIVQRAEHQIDLCSVGATGRATLCLPAETTHLIAFRYASLPNHLRRA